jgi:ubiquitin-like 1-activating enzyme E1 A
MRRQSAANPMFTIVKYVCGERRHRYVPYYQLDQVAALCESLTTISHNPAVVCTMDLCVQAKMSKTKVLYIHVTGVSTEIIKNLVLAGIRATLCDNRKYPDAVMDTPSFFLSAQDRMACTDTAEDQPAAKKPKYGTVAEAVQPVVEELNPLLGACEIVPTPVSELTDEFLSQFSIVVASRIGMSDAIRISKATTAAGGKFFLADCFGVYGAAAFDLGKTHTYRPEKGKELLDPIMLEPHVALETMFNVALADATNRFHKTPPPAWIRYRSILEYVEQTKSWPSEEKSKDFVKVVRDWIEGNSPSLLENELLSESALEDLAKVSTSEVAPVCAVLGGVIGNEIIKAISGKGEPANNTLLFDGQCCKAWTFLIKPKETK